MNEEENIIKKSNIYIHKQGEMRFSLIIFQKSTMLIFKKSAMFRNENLECEDKE